MSHRLAIMKRLLPLRTPSLVDATRPVILMLRLLNLSLECEEK